MWFWNVADVTRWKMFYRPRCFHVKWNHFVSQCFANWDRKLLTAVSVMHVCVCYESHELASHDLCLLLNFFFRSVSGGVLGSWKFVFWDNLFPFPSRFTLIIKLARTFIICWKLNCGCVIVFHEFLVSYLKFLFSLTSTMKYSFYCKQDHVAS